MKGSHGHEHPGMGHDEELGYYSRRVKALEAVLTEKGICSREEIERLATEGDARSPADGARIVARAWTDPEFKARLLMDAKAAVSELGYSESENLPDVVVAENTEGGASSGGVHAVFVLPDLAAWETPGLVQELDVPVAGGVGPPGGDAGVWVGGGAWGGGEGVGQHRRRAIPGAAGTSAGDGGLERRGAGAVGDAGLHGWGVGAADAGAGFGVEAEGGSQIVPTKMEREA